MESPCSRSLAALVLALGLTLTACQDDPTSPADPKVEPGLSAASAQATLTFRQVSTAHLHSCGVTTDDRAYCWGLNDDGRLGNGDPSGPETCAFDKGCSTRPIAVAGGLRFRQVTTAITHSCGLATDSRAYCWGSNREGQLGDGTKTDRSTPVAVAGGRRFRQISAGTGHTCAVNNIDRVLCWGAGGAGELGDGANTERLTPVSIRHGGLAFRQVSAGSQYTCATTTGNRAYCWGINSQGQLGDRTKTSRSVPTAVFGGHSFREVNAATRHTCSVTTDNRAYCWGSNFSRELGDGSDYQRRLRPMPVVGGRTFSTVATGAGFTCGVGTDQRGYCWGDNGAGRLGTGDGQNHPSPAAVQGNRQFTNLDAGTFHACAVTTGNKAFCWGDNSWGQLGDGNGGEFGDLSPMPVPVADPS